MSLITPIILKKPTQTDLFIPPSSSFDYGSFGGTSDYEDENDDYDYDYFDEEEDENDEY